MQWEFSKAVIQVAKLKDELWTAGYHIAIGGGCAWRPKGSDKDLDLFILPLFSLFDRRTRETPVQILSRLVVHFGQASPFSSSLGENATDQDYLGWTVGMFDTPDGRIDVFIHPEL